MTPLASARHLVQTLRLAVAAYCSALALRLALLNYEGSLALVRRDFLPLFLVAACALLPWQHWLNSVRQVRLFLWLWSGSAAALALLISWHTGSRGWWSYPIIFVFFLPALVGLELHGAAPRSPWRLNRAQWLAVGGWALWWVVLWWAALHGPGAEPREALMMARITWASFEAATVWLVLLKARVQGCDRSRARDMAAWFALGVSVLWYLLGTNFEAWLFAHSEFIKPDAVGVVLWNWLFVALALGLGYFFRSSLSFADVFFTLAILWQQIHVQRFPAVAPQVLVLSALLFTLLVGHRSIAWLALAWTANLVRFWYLPGVDTQQVMLNGLCGTAVGLPTLWLLRGLPGGAGRAVAAEVPAARIPWQRPPRLAPAQARLAVALGSGVGVLTAAGGLAFRVEPSPAYVQAVMLMGLLLSFGGYTLARYWFESDTVNQALRASEHDLFTFLDTADTGLVRCSRDLHYRAANSAYARLVGRPVSDIVGRSLPEVMGESGIAKVRPFIERVLQGERVEFETELPLDTGPRWIAAIYTPDRDEAGAIVGFVASVSDISARKTAEVALRRALEERTTLLEEVHHRVKNNLTVVSSLLSLQQRQTAHPEAIAQLQMGRDRIGAIALVHEQLYGYERFDRIDFKAYLERLCRGLEDGGAAAGRDSGIEVTGEGFELKLTEAVPCALLVNELVSNAVKHAFPAGRRGRVWVELGLEPDGSRMVRVGDDGVGMAHEGQRAGSLGLNLVKRLSQQLQALLEREPTAVGTVWRLRMAGVVAPDRLGRTDGNEDQLS